jgi:hypothetical protein
MVFHDENYFGGSPACKRNYVVDLFGQDVNSLEVLVL